MSTLQETFPNRLSGFRFRVFVLLDESQSSRSSRNRFINLMIMGLIILNLISIILESDQNIEKPYHHWFVRFELFSVIIFSIEYLLRLYVAPCKYPTLPQWKAYIKYFFSSMALVDLIAILPFYLPLFLKMDLRFVRALRILRLLRIFKLGRYSRTMRIVGQVLKDKRDELTITLFVTMILVVVASALMYNIEHEAQPEQFPSILHTFWWAVATLTTVGYGDVYPITPWGKLISGIIALLGIGLVALPTGILSSAFFDTISAERKKESGELDENEILCPHCGEPIHKEKVE